MTYNYMQHYAERLNGQGRYGGGFFSTLGEVFNPVTAYKSYRKKGVSRVLREAKEEVAESGAGVLNPFKDVEARKREDEKRRKDIAEQRKRVLEAEKRKIDAEIAREKAELEKMLAADDIPAHLRQNDGKGAWKKYAGYAIGAGVLLYGGRMIYMKMKVEK